MKFENMNTASIFTAICPTRQILMYIISNTDEVSVAQAVEELQGECIIPATVLHNGATYRVTSIRAGAFYERTTLKTIHIPHTVISIGNKAFYGCENLTSVDIPNSVIHIGDGVFDGCNNIDVAEDHPIFAVRKGQGRTEVFEKNTGRVIFTRP